MILCYNVSNSRQAPDGVYLVAELQATERPDPMPLTGEGIEGMEDAERLDAGSRLTVLGPYGEWILGQDGEWYEQTEGGGYDDPDRAACEAIRATIVDIPTGLNLTQLTELDDPNEYGKTKYFDPETWGQAGAGDHVATSLLKIVIPADTTAQLSVYIGYPSVVSSQAFAKFDIWYQRIDPGAPGGLETYQPEDFRVTTSGGALVFDIPGLVAGEDIGRNELLVVNLLAWTRPGIDDIDYLYVRNLDVVDITVWTQGAIRCGPSGSNTATTSVTSPYAIRIYEHKGPVASYAFNQSAKTRGIWSKEPLLIGESGAQRAFTNTGAVVLPRISIETGTTAPGLVYAFSGLRAAVAVRGDEEGRLTIPAVHDGSLERFMYNSAYITEGPIIKSGSIDSLLYSFYGCSEIRQITFLAPLKSGVNLQYTFYGCRHLKSLSIALQGSASVIKAFYNCTDLMDLDLHLSQAISLNQLSLAGGSNARRALRSLRLWAGDQEWTAGTNLGLSVAYCSLDEAGLAVLFGDLPRNNYTASVVITGNPGADGIHDSTLKIATDKGWTVTGATNIIDDIEGDDFIITLTNPEPELFDAADLAPRETSHGGIVPMLPAITYIGPVEAGGIAEIGWQTPSSSGTVETIKAGDRITGNVTLQPFVAFLPPPPDPEPEPEGA